MGLYEDLLEKFIESSEKFRCLISTRAQSVARQTDFEEKQIFLMAFSEDIRSFIVRKRDGSALSSSTDMATQQIKCVDIRPEDSISQVSRSSRITRISTVRSHASTSASCAGSVHSSVSLLRLKEEQRHAELMVRAASAKEQHELEITKHELKLKEDDLRLHTELNISAARLNALNKFEERGDARSTHSSTRSMPSAKFVGEAIQPEHFTQGAYVPDIKVATPIIAENEGASQRIYPHHNTMMHPHRQDSGELIATALDGLADRLSNRDNLPKMMPEKFNGDFIQYTHWIQSFETIIELHTTAVCQRMFFLGKCTTGEAHTAIQGFISVNTEEAYRNAKATLHKRYGNKYLLSKEFKRKIVEWPLIRYGDGKGLREYSDFLWHCATAMKTSNHLCSLDSEEEIAKILQKLPNYIVDRWSRIVDKWLNCADEDEQRYPPFESLCGFLEQEARIACNAVNYKHYSTEKKDVQLRGFHKKKSVNSLSTTVLQDDKSPEDSEMTVLTTSHTATRNDEKRCVLCERCHELESCKQFQNMVLGERRNYLRKKGYCYGCMNGRHLSRTCNKRKECQTCGGLHPTLLHFEVKKRPTADSTSEVTTHRIETIVSHQSGNGGPTGHYNSLIMPVMVYKNDTPHERIMVYALLDDQSNSSFISQQTLSQLKGTGRPTTIKLSTMLEERTIASEIVHGLSVCNLNGDESIPLHTAYLTESIPANRSLIPRPETAMQWRHLNSIANQLMSYKEDMTIGLLIGLNCPKAIKPRELLLGEDEDPWAVRTSLGWGIAGIVDPSYARAVESTNDTPCQFVFRTHVTEISPLTVSRMFELDFNERTTDDKISVEDRRFLNIVSTGIHRRSDGHFEMPLPFKDDVQLPNNRPLTVKRLSSLKSKLERNEVYKNDYTQFMSNIISCGYAEPIPIEELNAAEGRTWYIPHHGIYHSKKPGKLRVVFDCSAEYRGEVLNHHLLQGPDMLNNLAGILCRFRQKAVAISCDIEGMFHQVGVNREDRDFLRFLWWENCDLKNEPKEYRMTVHLFGATSSPGCANYALKATSDMFEKDCGMAAADFVRHNFYVDDGLKSVATCAEALHLVHSSRELCKKGGFNLHKFVCNDTDVLSAIAPELRANGLQSMDLTCDSSPVERTLGVHWCIESDTFQFRIEIKDRPFTRRGILSTVSSVYDPLGLVSPCVLIGKQILQELVRDGGDWDDPIPDTLRARWEKWRNEVLNLAEIRIPRCYNTGNSDSLIKVELHHFSDASLSGYGQCSYLRLIDSEGNISSVLVMGKSRVTPTKTVTIPRLELTAAVVSVRIANFLQKQLDYESIEHYYWTDSKAVLGYIANESRRFRIFVANRVQEIHDSSDTKAWHHVASKTNPADIASRGATADELLHADKWWHGPEFLCSSSSLPLNDGQSNVEEGDPEVKNVVTHSTHLQPVFSNLLERITYFSDWHRAKRAVAVCLRFRDLLLNKAVKRPMKLHTRTALNTGVKSVYKPVNVAELQRAEHVIIKAAQEAVFPAELTSLRRLKTYAAEKQQCTERNFALKRNSSLYRLDPYLSNDGLIHVGGRIKRANIPHSLAHPVVLPKDSYVTQLVIKHYHQRTCHSGREITLNELRASGYWVIQARATVAAHLWNCVQCKRLRGTTLTQKMADLPLDRVEPSEPFTYSAVDFFGPFYIKEGRSEKKRWGVLFTCMASRAIHIETANTLSTNSFISAYRRFVCRRGPVRQLRSDRGTNFVGACAELTAALSEMDDGTVSAELLKDSCDWVVFKTNPPHASHMGGVWERMIRSVRNVLSALLDTHGDRLDDEQLRTLMIEAEAVVNSRPITYSDMTNPDSLEPLSPSRILTLKSRVVLPPPGIFKKEDVYCRKRWRAVQFLANQFWNRWRTEYLLALQERQKWSKSRRNLQIGDIVLLKDECTPRCRWPLARVEQVYPSEDGLVRKVNVRRGQSTYDRPVHKLVLLLTPGIPDEEPASE